MEVNLLHKGVRTLICSKCGSAITGRTNKSSSLPPVCITCKKLRVREYANKRNVRLRAENKIKHGSLLLIKRLVDK